MSRGAQAVRDACYARLHALTRKQLRDILDPHGLSERELEDILDPWEDPTFSGPHLLPEEPASPVRGIADELAAALGRLG